MKVTTMTHPHTTDPHRILIVDDTSTIVESTIENLRQNGFPHCEYQTVAAAVEFESLLQQRGWDVVVCKYAHVPFETTDLIRLAQRLQPQTPVLVVGEQVTTREAFELGRLGVHEFIETSDTPRLIACVQQALSSKQPDVSTVTSITAAADSSAMRQLRLVLDSMQDAIMSLSLPDRRLIFVSSSYERVFGYPAEVFQKNRELYKQVMPPDEVEMATAALQTLYRDGFVELDHRVIFPNGEVHWLHRRAWIIYDPQGKPIQLVDIARDITARKQAEEALRAVNRKQRAILDSLPDMMFHVRADGTILDYHFHASIADLVLPPELFLGKSMSDFVNSPLVPSGTLQQAVDAMQTVTTLRQPIIFEYTMPDQHTYEARMLPIEDSDELIVLSRDITERKQAEAKLRESEGKYRGLLESTDTVVAMFDWNGTVLYANEPAARPFGWTVEQMLGKAYDELFPPEVAETQLANIRSVIQTGTGMVREAMSIIAGEERWYRTSIQPVRDSTETVTAALINSTDITLIKTSEAALRQSAEDLRQQKAFLEILLTISSRFITLPVDKLETVMAATLEEIGTFLSADRAYIFEYHFEQGTTTNTYEWCAEGIVPQIENLQAFPLEGMEAWISMHRRGKTIQIPTVADRDPDDAVRRVLEPQNIQSFIAIPMMDEGACVGFIGLDSVRRQRTYDDSDQQLLQLFAALLVNIRSRVNTLKALEASEKRYRQIVETAQEGIWLIDLEGRTVYLNQRMADMLGYRIDEVLGANFFAFMDEEGRRLAEYYLERRRQGIQEQHDFCFKRQDGSDLWVIINTNLVLDDNQRASSVLGMLTDITERKLADDALERSEAALQAANHLLEQRIRERTAELQKERNLLRTLIDAIPDSIYVKDRQHRILLSNLAHFRSIGMVDDTETIGKTDLDLFPPEMANQFHADEDRLFATEQAIINLEEHNIRPDVSDEWMLTTKVPLRDVQGDLVGLVGITRDITAIKAAGEALRESEARYQSVVQSQSELICRYLPDLTLTFVNNAYCRYFEKTPEDLVGRSFLDFIPESQRASVKAFYEDLVQTRSTSVYEHMVIRADGSTRWQLWTDTVIVNDRNEVVAIQAVGTDITERKRAEETLRISEERYRATVAAMSEGVVVQDRDGAIQLCNSAAERILGLTADQMIERASIDPRWRAIHEDGSPFPGETHPAMVTLRTGEPQANVVMGVHKPDDTLTWILINSQALVDSISQQPYAVVTTFADITAPKQAEAAIKLALADEKELGELKSRFISMASHEFRTPLAAILAATETLTLYWERMDRTKINDRLSRVREQVNRMTAIMEDVLQLTRMQTGRTKFEPLPGDLDALCRRVVSDLAELPDYHDRIHYECSQHPLNAVFDNRLVQQVITNLLHNALKYSPPETTVRIALAQAVGQITLRITDEGIGIPTEDVKRLFEPFHRAANVGEISGTGLGLAIVKEAVELHGGSITVESQVNVGTTFTITLPEHP